LKNEAKSGDMSVFENSFEKVSGKWSKIDPATSVIETSFEKRHTTMKKQRNQAILITNGIIFHSTFVDERKKEKE